MFLNKLHCRTQCSFGTMPSGREGREVLKCGAGPATKNGLVLECVQVTLYTGNNLISAGVKQLQ